MYLLFIYVVHGLKLGDMKFLKMALKNHFYRENSRNLLSYVRHHHLT